MINKKLIDVKDKIFVAGHRGMVGSAICRVLIKNGYKNIIKCEKKDLDLRRSSDVKDFFEKNKPDIVILSAAKVGGIFANNNFPGDFIIDNLMIQTNVIQSSFQFGVKRFLFLGSSCIYPKFSKQPIKEKYLLDGPLENTNQYYAIAKISGLKLCEALSKQYDFDAICLMPTNLYGTGDNYNLQNSHVMPALIRKFYEAKENNFESVHCWGDGSPLREFLHCDDLADACLYSLENINLDLLRKYYPSIDDFSAHINVGTGNDISIKNLAEMISKILEYKGEIIWDLEKPNGTHQKKLDISLMSDLGWKYSIPFKEGVKKTIDEYSRIYLSNK